MAPLRYIHAHEPAISTPRERMNSPIHRSASVIAYDEGGRVLLARRALSKSVDPGLWETIGGKVEGGETSLRCTL